MEVKPFEALDPTADSPWVVEKGGCGKGVITDFWVVEKGSLLIFGWEQGVITDF